jgi:hypothetical protein
MTTATVTFRRVGNWLMEYDSTKPNTVYSYPEFTKTKTFGDSGVMYDNGTMAWNFPERIPQYVRNVAPAFIRKCQSADKN